MSSIWLAAVIWLIARAFQQRDLLPALKLTELPSSQQPAKVAVIVPARDEAANIERCLCSLVAQTYPQSSLRISVFVKWVWTYVTRQRAPSMIFREPSRDICERAPGLQ